MHGTVACIFNTCLGILTPFTGVTTDRCCTGCTGTLCCSRVPATLYPRPLHMLRTSRVEPCMLFGRSDRLYIAALPILTKHIAVCYSMMSRQMQMHCLRSINLRHSFRFGRFGRMVAAAFIAFPIEDEASRFDRAGHRVRVKLSRSSNSFFKFISLVPLISRQKSSEGWSTHKLFQLSIGRLSI